MICIFCFYNISNGIQSFLAFSDSFRHCNVITFDGDCYLAHESDKTGMYVQRLKTVPRLTSLIRALKHIESLTAIIVVDVRERPAIAWKPFVVRSCNEIDRYIAGVDIGFTFNPKHLYTKLIKYDGSNFEVLHTWRR
jgi:hypothetical protein